MYISPFWAGVLATLLCELLGLIILAYVSDKEEDTNAD